jgi:hypothetical protein
MINKNLVGTLRQSKEFEVEEWGGTVFLKRLSLKEMETLIKNAEDNGKGDVKHIVITLISALIDEENKPVFDLNDFDNLMNEPFDTLMSIYNEVMAYNKLDPEAKKKN